MRRKAPAAPRARRPPQPHAALRFPGVRARPEPPGTRSLHRASNLSIEPTRLRSEEPLPRQTRKKNTLRGFAVPAYFLHFKPPRAIAKMQIPQQKGHRRCSSRFLPTGPATPVEFHDPRPVANAMWVRYHPPSTAWVMRSRWSRAAPRTPLPSRRAVDTPNTAANFLLTPLEGTGWRPPRLPACPHLARGRQDGAVPTPRSRPRRGRAEGGGGASPLRRQQLSAARTVRPAPPRGC